MHDVIIIGGGVAGLCCAIELHRAGVPFQLLESQGILGGRIHTDRVEGFLCDRGFQILLTAYPEAARLLDYKALDLRPFYPGALVWVDGAFHRVADPFRRPMDALRSVRSPIGSLADKARILKLRRAALAGEIEELHSRPQATTLSYLESAGFSQVMIDPAQPPDALEPVERQCQIEPAIFVCGDHRHMATINGAMVSGRKAAQDVVHYLKKEG